MLTTSCYWHQLLIYLIRRATSLLTRDRVSMTVDIWVTSSPTPPLLMPNNRVVCWRRTTTTTTARQLKRMEAKGWGMLMLFHSSSIKALSIHLRILSVAWVLEGPVSRIQQLQIAVVKVLDQESTISMLVGCHTQTSIFWWPIEKTFFVIRYSSIGVRLSLGDN